ncbi:MAG TPA: hypothetical protein PLO93_02380, partial [Candidatus Omnitrophota bacterium]|nr:hypothetical protein [Candidatus Omnitrophota bacterium]
MQAELDAIDQQLNDVLRSLSEARAKEAEALLLMTTKEAEENDARLAAKAAQASCKKAKEEALAQRRSEELARTLAQDAEIQAQGFEENENDARSIAEANEQKAESTSSDYRSVQKLASDKESAMLREQADEQEATRKVYDLTEQKLQLEKQAQQAQAIIAQKEREAKAYRTKEQNHRMLAEQKEKDIEQQEKIKQEARERMIKEGLQARSASLWEQHEEIRKLLASAENDKGTLQRTIDDNVLSIGKLKEEQAKNKERLSDVLQEIEAVRSKIQESRKKIYDANNGYGASLKERNSQAVASESGMDELLFSQRTLLTEKQHLEERDTEISRALGGLQNSLTKHRIAVVSLNKKIVENSPKFRRIRKEAESVDQLITDLQSAIERANAASTEYVLAAQKERRQEDENRQLAIGIEIEIKNAKSSKDQAKKMIEDLEQQILGKKAAQETAKSRFFELKSSFGSLQARARALGEENKGASEKAKAARDQEKLFCQKKEESLHVARLKRQEEQEARQEAEEQEALSHKKTQEHNLFLAKAREAKEISQQQAQIVEAQQKRILELEILQQQFSESSSKKRSQVGRLAQILNLLFKEINEKILNEENLRQSWQEYEQQYNTQQTVYASTSKEKFDAEQEVLKQQNILQLSQQEKIRQETIAYEAQQIAERSQTEIDHLSAKILRAQQDEIRFGQVMIDIERLHTETTRQWLAKISDEIKKDRSQGQGASPISEPFIPVPSITPASSILLPSILMPTFIVIPGFLSRSYPSNRGQGVLSNDAIRAWLAEKISAPTKAVKENQGLVFGKPLSQSTTAFSLLRPRENLVRDEISSQTGRCQNLPTVAGSKISSTAAFALIDKSSKADLLSVAGTGTDVATLNFANRPLLETSSFRGPAPLIQNFVYQGKGSGIQISSRNKFKGNLVWNRVSSTACSLFFSGFNSTSKFFSQNRPALNPYRGREDFNAPASVSCSLINILRTVSICFLAAAILTFASCKKEEEDLISQGIWPVSVTTQNNQIYVDGTQFRIKGLTADQKLLTMDDLAQIKKLGNDITLRVYLPVVNKELLAKAAQENI